MLKTERCAGSTLYELTFENHSTACECEPMNTNHLSEQAHWISSLDCNRLEEDLGRMRVQDHQFGKGPMRVLNPRSMLQDEGPAGVAKIAWNLATHKDLRERVESTKSVIESHKDTLGYIALRAIKK